MNNTIMVTGTAKNVGNKVLYNVHVWGSTYDEPMQFIRGLEGELSGYDELWKEAKIVAQHYFPAARMDDGAYTTYLDHLIIIS